MRKTMTALSFAVLALAGVGIGVGGGVAQTGTQVADVKLEFPSYENDRGNGTYIHDIGDLADIRYEYPRPEGDSGTIERTPGSYRG